MGKREEGILDIHIAIREILKASKKPLKAWHVQAIVLRKYNKRYEGSTITARMREMADVRCDLSDYTYTINT